MILPSDNTSVVARLLSQLMAKAAGKTEPAERRSAPGYPGRGAAVTEVSTPKSPPALSPASVPPNEDLLFEALLDAFAERKLAIAEAGAFTGTGVRRFLRSGAKCTAIEAYWPAFKVVQAKVGRRGLALSALLADRRRPYRIANKDEVRLIGERPIYLPSTARAADVMAQAYDELLGGEQQPDLLVVSGCNACEALLGAQFFFRHSGAKHVLLRHDPGYMPADPAHDHMLLYSLLADHRLLLYSMNRIFNINEPLPMARAEFHEAVTGGTQIFLAQPEQPFMMMTWPG